MTARKGQLGIGGDGGTPETDLVRQVNDVVYRFVTIAPEIEFAALEIDIAAALAVAVEQMLAYLFVGLYARFGNGIDRAVSAAEIATIQQKNDRLQGFASACQRAHVPPCQVGGVSQFYAHLSIKYSEILTSISSRQKPVLTLRMAYQRSR